MSAIARHHVQVGGLDDGPPMVFAHGFGCDQQMWRHVTPEFATDHCVVTFDHVGCGGSDPTAYDSEAYSSLDRYALDVVEIITELELSDIVFVGHSVSAMVGVLASQLAPERFSALVLVCPSPRYIDDDDYVGGFAESDIAELLGSLDSNYLGWSRATAPMIMGNPDRPELSDELTESFCRLDPEIARQFARVTFLSDNRSDLAKVDLPTLIVQCAHDVIAPPAVGSFVNEQIRGSELVTLDVAGHCPNLSAPTETANAIRDFVSRLAHP